MSDDDLTTGPQEDAQRPARWAERFLAEHPGGGENLFAPWAEGQPRLVEEASLRQAVLEEVGMRLRAAELLSEDVDPSAEGSVFRRRTGRPSERKRSPGQGHLEPGRRIGQFVLRGFIAQGGMGQVWEAEDTELRRRVALKLVLPDRVDERSLALFAREARAGGRLNHRNLVTTLGYGTDAGLTWIAQELVEGSWTVNDSLETLRAENAVPKGYYEEVARLVASIADGMQAAHDAGVIHRDLKPQNILVDDTDQPKVTDFGLARLSEDSFLSRTGEVGGTLHYMSPEQVTGRRNVLDHRTDVFSLGVLLYEFLTLRRPFEGDTTHQVVQQILEWDPPDASRVRSQCPHELAIICAKAMEKSVERRYANMAEMASDLRRHISHEPIHARPPGALVRGGKWVRRHPGISAAGGIASVALAVVSALSLDLAATGADLREQSELAEQRATANAELARIALASEELATNRANDILSLSATKDLDDLIAEAELLWPPNTEMLPRYERWLAGAQQLIDGRRENPAAGIKARPSLADHERKMAELVARSVPEQDEERLRRARAHDAYPELERARAELSWQRRMLGMEEWPDPVEVEAAMTREALPTSATELLEHARALVGPRAEDLGQVTRGWILAGRLLDLDAGEGAPDHYARALMTMGWAEARHGRNDEALRAMEGAVVELEAIGEHDGEGQVTGEVPGGGTSGGEGELSGASAKLMEDAKTLEAFMARWDGEGRVTRKKELGELEARITALEIQTGERVFEDPEDGWWQRQLANLVRGIRALHDPETGLAGNTLAQPFGWGVEKRAEFSRSTLERSVSGPDASDRWSEALLAIATSEKYGGMELAPQPGLLPLGADPDSGLWEFAHLQTGEPAVRGEDGTLELTERSGLVLVLIPGGTFWMGGQLADPAGQNYDPQAEEIDGPVHEVRLLPYFLSKYEMTQGQWERATAARPSNYGTHRWSPEWSRGRPEASLLHPVESVTWTECLEWMARLELELPTEAQWERACRAGTSTPYWSGMGLQALEGVDNISDQHARRHGAAAWANHEAIDDGNTIHAAVGTFPANPYGLHEMHGNVREWCRDGFDPKAYDPEGRRDPVVPWTDSPYRVYRGGGFNLPARAARSANRNSLTPETRPSSVGLRPARRVIG